MYWILLVIGIVLGIIFGALKLKKFGFIISFVLFVLFWRLLLNTGYTISHMSTYVIGQESAINGEFGDWLSIILASMLFAGVSTMIPEILALFHPLFKFLDPVLEPISDWFLGLFEPNWSSFNPKKEKKAIEEIKKMEDKKKLIMIARESDNQNISKAVIEKIKDEEILFEIAKPGGKAFTCKNAINKISNVDMIEKLLQLTDSPENNEYSIIKDDIIKHLKERLEILNHGK